MLQVCETLTFFFSQTVETARLGQDQLDVSEQCSVDLHCFVVLRQRY